MKSLYELTENMREIYEALEAGHDDAAMDKLISTEAEAEGKIDNTLQVVKQFDADIAALDEEVKRLMARKKSLVTDKARLKAGIMRYMVATEQQKLKTPLFSISVTKGRQSVAVHDLESLPDNLVKTTRSADKTAIKKALDAGEAVKGATLETGEPSLTIR